MSLLDIYNHDFSLLGSPKMVAFYECLENIPYKDRKIQPAIGGISITSDGYLIADGNFLGSADELEDNLYGLCEHFNVNQSEVSRLMCKTFDWRKGGNAWSK